MKSTITQLERRFDIPSYLIGVIDGSFEIGKHRMLMRQQTLSTIFRFGVITSGCQGSCQCSILLRRTVYVAIYSYGTVILYVTQQKEKNCKPQLWAKSPAGHI